MKLSWMLQTVLVTNDSAGQWTLDQLVAFESGYVFTFNSLSRAELYNWFGKARATCLLINDQDGMVVFLANKVQQALNIWLTWQHSPCPSHHFDASEVLEFWFMLT